MLHKTPEVPALEVCYTGPPDIVLGAVTCGTCAHSMSSLRGSKLYAGQASGASVLGLYEHGTVVSTMPIFSR